MTQPTPDQGEAFGKRLELADWRRRIADLYSEVRAAAVSDPEAAWRHWRAAREELFRGHPQSPVPADARGSFRANHWPYDPALRFEAVVELDDALAGNPAPGTGRGYEVSLAAIAETPFGGRMLSLPISTGGEEAFTRIGFVTVPFRAGARRLGLYWMAGYAGGLFLPFRDGTSSHETYGAGRYLLDAAKSADLGAGTVANSLVLDFNFAFQPSCAFDPRWACPLAPTENYLDVWIAAGERLP